MTYHVYILASRMHGTLYVGVTNDLARRVDEHRRGLGSRFTREHGVTRLVFYEGFEDVEAAIAAEKRLKRWHRAWKVQLVERNNPLWKDLYLELNM
ncbi:GIY-YIG nuclease family protein [Microvirga tunisiensis]|uniref:GIY-YIG nuclease family protein n=1 Tax=Pannonibacter tanglangensis TaxID=2750084 RepID=A0A7X5EZJ4_9HYPH|nr:GIY-YIG nuclease family protein [Pannonibacter sp. XCT-53]NBN77018.1 GIY-YIG nuclease family protein [Pannonibacter sp. XCT-53]